MSTILEEIVMSKRREVAAARAQVSEAALERRLDQRVREAIAVRCGFLDETSAGSRLEDVHHGGLRGACCREKRLEVKVAADDRGRCE